MKNHSITRRNLLKAAVATAPLYVSARVMGLDGAPPSEIVRVGLIGLGFRGKLMLERASPTVSQMRIAAVCDCLKPRVDAVMAEHAESRSLNSYTDFREMIEKESLDGVMVITTTHARAWVTCHAMAMGQDVYIEKPMCLTVREGREMIQRARKYKRVTQIGTQQRSIPQNKWAGELVRNGAIGKVHTVLASNFIGPRIWEPSLFPADKHPDAARMIAGGDAKFWDLWTNQAVLRPFHRQLLAWPQWWDFDGGGRMFGVTGWGTHSFDEVNRALGTDDTSPTEVLLEEPVSDQQQDQFFGPRAKTRLWFADGREIRCHLDYKKGPGLGATFVGEQGKIEINRGKISSNPPEIAESPDNPGPVPAGTEITQYHIEDWVRCIKNRERCAADIEIAQRAHTICHLINIAREIGRVGEKLRWDPEAERFTNCDEANVLLSRSRRRGYELPG